MGLNSTMVRFIPEYKGIKEGDAFVSQFHYGSIHTHGRCSRSCVDCLVSIPLWFDSYKNGK